MKFSVLSVSLQVGALGFLIGTLAIFFADEVYTIVMLSSSYCYQFLCVCVCFTCMCIYVLCGCVYIIREFICTCVCGCECDKAG